MMLRITLELTDRTLGPVLATKSAAVDGFYIIVMPDGTKLSTPMNRIVVIKEEPVDVSNTNDVRSGNSDKAAVILADSSSVQPVVDTGGGSDS
jgi:hypothetical protein